MEKILEIKNLKTAFENKGQTFYAVDGISLDVYKGKTLGIVGESGCGKSVTALSILRLISIPGNENGNGKIVSGEIFYRGQNLLNLTLPQMRAIRGNKISMIFQEPMTSLNPVFTIGEQIMESLRTHKQMSRAQAKQRAIELLELVEIQSPTTRIDQYPHQLSGGMRQRVMIAIALSCEPEILIADEPTTALDVTIQAQILKLIKNLQKKLGMAVVLITHDLGVVAEMADNVAVMFKGKIIENAPVQQIFKNPQHAYTQSLLQAIPLSKPSVNPVAQPIVRIENLKKSFSLTQGFFSEKKYISAIENVSLEIIKGETLGLVGESGSGKSTLGRCLIKLIEPTEGKIFFRDSEITSMTQKQFRPLRKKIQIIFQDPYSSLNPRMTVESILKEPLAIHKLHQGKENERIEELLKLCGLSPDHIDRYPHEFSGGQRQRICIARALAVEPELIVCDEPVSALDVTIQAQILNLLMDLQTRLGLTYLFISHDLKIVHEVSHRIAVMYLGRIVEQASAEALFQSPKHPYTQALLAAIPTRDPDRKHFDTAISS